MIPACLMGQHLCTDPSAAAGGRWPITQEGGRWRPISRQAKGPDHVNNSLAREAPQQTHTHTHTRTHARTQQHGLHNAGWLRLRAIYSIQQQYYFPARAQPGPSRGPALPLTRVGGWLGVQPSHWPTLRLNWQFAALLCCFQNLPGSFQANQSANSANLEANSPRRRHNLTAVGTASILTNTGSPGFFSRSNGAGGSEQRWWRETQHQRHHGASALDRTVVARSATRQDQTKQTKADLV